MSSDTTGLLGAKVGDLVVISSRRGWDGYESRLDTITKATKPFIVLSDGSKWGRSGNRWGENSGGYFSHRDVCSKVVNEKAVRESIKEERAERLLKDTRREAYAAVERYYQQLSLSEAQSIVKVCLKYKEPAKAEGTRAIQRSDTGGLS